MNRDQRATHRRETWSLMSLDEPFEVVGETAADRLRRMEALRRASYAMRGLDYPEGPTPRDERASWPVFVRGE